jgi:hypothetical protein
MGSHATHNVTPCDQGVPAPCRPPRVRRMLVLIVVVGSGFLAAACGGATPTAQKSTSVTAEPLIVAPAPTAIAITAVRTPEVVAQNQAAQLGAAEEQYATCFVYAALDQSLVGDAAPAGAPVMQSCSTAGLTHAEVAEIQGLIVHAS